MFGSGEVRLAHHLRAAAGDDANYAGHAFGPDLSKHVNYAAIGTHSGGWCCGGPSPRNASATEPASDTAKPRFLRISVMAFLAAQSSSTIRTDTFDDDDFEAASLRPGVGKSDVCADVTCQVFAD